MLTANFEHELTKPASSAWQVKDVEDAIRSSARLLPALRPVAPHTPAQFVLFSAQQTVIRDSVAGRPKQLSGLHADALSFNRGPPAQIFALSTAQWVAGSTSSMIWHINNYIIG